VFALSNIRLLRVSTAIYCFLFEPASQELPWRRKSIATDQPPRTSSGYIPGFVRTVRLPLQSAPDIEFIFEPDSQVIAAARAGR
jgi:hypothetical protein